MCFFVLFLVNSQGCATINHNLILEYLSPQKEALCQWAVTPITPNLPSFLLTLGNH